MEWEKRSAFVFIKTRPGTAEEVNGRLKKWQQTIGTFMIHSPWDIMVWLDSGDLEETHRLVSEIRDWIEVERTSTSHAFMGFKRDYWFWERPTCAWIRLRSRAMHETYEDLKKRDWMCIFASIPGEWDFIGLIAGKNWEEIFGWIGDLKASGYEVESYTQYRWWWNRSWKNNWYSPSKAFSGTC